MKKTIALVAASLTLAILPVTVQAQATPPEPPPAIDGMVHWVGEFEPGSDLEHYADWVLEQVGVPADQRASRKPSGHLMTELDMVWLYLTSAEADRADGLIGQAPLMAAEATGIVSLPTPVDGGGPLAAPGQSGFQQIPVGMLRIGVPFDEWVAAPSSNGVRVAVIDTGIDGRHDDLNVVGGFNCTQDERGPDGYDIDPHGHGTHVAGTIGAKHNDIYVTSAAPGVALLSEVTFSATGSASGAMVLCALNKALEHDADIISASLGGEHVATRCGGPSVYTNGWCKAAQRTVVVVAAGNDAVDAVYKGPANVPGVVTVGAIIDFDGVAGGVGLGYPGCGLFHRDDYLAVFSNWGSAVDVVAPGACILSTLPGQSWGFSSGTSMATPHVSSVFAAFMARFPDCRGQDAIKTVLRYAEQFPIDYGGWLGAYPPPMIRYVDEYPLRIQDPEHPTPCNFRVD
ncbi:MAG: S8 family serine peptidase [Gemmatimonadaceae bacterium]|nr:S8 family serine peptidase [Gemmatimonadaceae bacterium]